MAHELDTRLNRRVNYASYVPDSHWEEDEELLALEAELESSPPTWKSNCFVRFMERFAYLVILLILLLAAGCCTLLYFYAPVPDFLTGSDPTKGFETRGTDIHRGAWTIRNLYERLDKEYFLTPNASLVLDEFNLPEDFFSPHPGQGIFPAFRAKHPSPTTGQAKRVKRELSTHSDPDHNGECPPLYLHAEYSFKFAMRPIDNGDMLTLENLKAQCQLEERVIRKYVQTSNSIVSLPRMILCTKNKEYAEKDCASLTDQDILHFRFLLSLCAPFYYNNTLTSRRLDVPDMCRNQSHLLQGFFKFMAPLEFYNPNMTAIEDTRRLRTVLTYVEWNDILVPDGEHLYRETFEGKDVSNKRMSIVALNVPHQMDVKFNLFSDYLMSDVEKYFSLALALILFIMLIYTRSLALMIATVLNVAISFVFACTVYFFVFRLKFFPFINLLAGLVLIAVGADDVFIFYDTWKQTRREDKTLTMSQTLSKTYAHAALSIFVTSLTTASAFYTNFVSTSITCIRCFGIFAGTAILINFFVMATWTPAVVIVLEKICNFFREKCSCVKITSEHCTNNISKVSQAIYGRCFPTLIGRAWFVWIFLLLGVGIGGSIVVFVTPKLQLPKSQDFQLFPESNVLENWDMNYAHMFAFEGKEGAQGKIPLYFVFGFEAKDDGNWLDPDDLGGDVTGDKHFDFSSNATQLWLRDFCLTLKNQSFVDDLYRHQHCSMIQYGELFKDYCENPLYHMYIGKCCNNFKVPYSPYQLEQCVPGLQVLTGGSMNTMGDPVYDKSNNIEGFVMFTYTNMDFSMSYEDMQRSYEQIEKFAENTFPKAPQGLKSGFFSGRYTFTFYDLQRAIAKGTYMSISLSLGIAFVIMFLTSMNILITLYAIITIACAIISTVACIVLLGWELNIIESITISLAVGLSIDFTIHYGVAYRLATAADSLTRVNESFTRVGSAVAMAALTTFAAGAAMMPSHVVAYTKLGIFLMLVMTFSWVYSTFFFQAICRIMGPRGNFCQIPCVCSNKKDELSRPLITEDDDDSLITF